MIKYFSKSGVYCSQNAYCYLLSHIIFYALYLAFSGP